MSRFITIGFLVSSLLLLAPFSPPGPFTQSLCAESSGACTEELATTCDVDGVLTFDARNI